MPGAMDVANYFLAAFDVEPENDLTNLKLQKLCAYAQAISLAYLGRPLFPERIEAWQHGPVEPAVYWKFAAYKNNVLPGNGLSEEFARAPFDDEQKFVLELVKSYYGRYSAWNLRNRSHKDFPGDFGSKHTIPEDAIQKAFEQYPLVESLRHRPVRGG